MANTALITGASSGIGKELANYHASKGGDLVLVARREDVLNQLKTKFEDTHNIRVTVIAADLSDPQSAENIFKVTEEKKIQIDILINNAGFGGHGKFYERELKKDQSMIQVNVTSLISLTHLYLQGMVQRNSGKILNVASTAGFLPGPLQATYYATKAFVLSFTQAIAQELSKTNVSATALCPGPVATEFVAAGNLEGVEVFDKAASPKSVAICGYDAMMKKELVKINEKTLGFMLNWVVPLVPRRMVLKMSQKSMEKVH